MQKTKQKPRIGLTCIGVFMIAFSVIILAGSVKNILSIELSARLNAPLLILMTCLSVGGFIALAKSVFRLIDSIEKQDLLTVGIFAVITAILLLIVGSMRVAPNGDSLDDIDTAFYLLSHSRMESDIVHAPFMRLYGNNDLLIILLKYAMRFFQGIGIRDHIAALSCMNLLAILAAHFFLFLSVGAWEGKKAANKVLIIAGLNPVYYGLVHWLYSLTFSLPIMFLGLYLAIRILKSNRALPRILLSLLEGIILFLGLQIRPTAVFPLIAIAVCLALLDRRKLKPALLMCLGVTALVFCLLNVGWKSVRTAYFGEFEEKNLAFTYWFTVGSHGNGTLATQNQKDMSYLMNIAPEEKIPAGFQRAMQYYKDNGLPETLRLWYEKIQITWSDGYAGIDGRLCLGQTDTGFFSFLAGDRNQLFLFYTQVHRLLLVMGTAVYSLRLLRDRQSDVGFISPVALVTVFGGILFYILWEAKNVYSAPFIFFQAILTAAVISEEKADCFQSFLQKQGRKKQLVPVLSMIMVLLSVVTCAGLFVSLSNLRQYSNVYVQGLNANRVQAPIDDYDTISQSFSLRHGYNSLRLKASMPGGTEIENVSDATLTVKDSQDHTVLEKVLSPSMLAGGVLTVDLDVPLPEGAYRLTITRNDASKPPISFYTQNTYYADLYDGDLEIVRGEEHQPRVSDLMMNIAFKSNGNQYPPYLILIIVILSLLVYSFPAARMYLDHQRSLQKQAK